MSNNKLLRQLALEQLTSGLRPKYCSDCGTVMFPLRLTEPGALGKFDVEGNRRFLITYKCPKQRWYHLGWKHVTIIGGPIKV